MYANPPGSRKAMPGSGVALEAQHAKRRAPRRFKTDASPQNAS